MYQFIPNRIKLKIFVKETNDEIPTENPKTNRNYFPVTRLTGDKAKELYEEIIKEPSNCEKTKSATKQKLKGEKKTKSSLSVKRNQGKSFKNLDLLWMSQNNDVKNLKAFFVQKRNNDVNIVDDFGWTPLMCASCSGATEAVKILLENGADPHKCDRLGNTALKLAQNKNKKEIAEILENLAKKPEPETLEDSDDSEELKSFFCSLCKENFQTSKNKHESSTLHLFNSRFKAQTFYGIPESNKGFQLLLRKGWDKEKGLGPEGTGRKFPIKAIMKKDRTGIGAQPLPDRNRSEAHHTVKYENKKQRICNKNKEKNFEKNFRLEFS